MIRSELLRNHGDFESVFLFVRFEFDRVVAAVGVDHAPGE